MSAARSPISRPALVCVRRVALAYAASALGALGGVACAPGNQQPVTAIRSGTSFGHCAGYCTDQLDVAGRRAHYERTAWRGPNETTPPPQRFDFDLAPTTWEELAQLAAHAQIAALDSVIGCPDCADGGKEWIELTVGGVTKRVAFGFGEYPASLAPLGKALARIREDAKRRTPS